MEFLLSPIPILHVYSLYKVENKSRNYWPIFKMSLPKYVLCLKVHFLWQLKDMNKNILSKDREAVQMR